MNIKVETEKKYYCQDPTKIIELATALNFKQVKKVIENDEYFTDIDSLYIKNRTCLRIRNNDNLSLEITFKGKSSMLLGQYCKLENNISCGIKEYDNFVNLLSSLGYYSYVKVEKERLIYSLEKDNYSYNIMIDKLLNIGGFVEFEILSDRENARKDDLKNELDNFVNNFITSDFEEATKPYRDIVAEDIYKKLVNNNESEDLYINIDSIILDYQQDFFNKYKENIKNNDLSKLLDDYFDNLIFDNKELLVMFDLLNRINYKVYFTTQAKEQFLVCLFKKLGITFDNVIYLKTDIDYENLKNNKKMFIGDKEIRKINSDLLILINN